MPFLTLSPHYSARHHSKSAHPPFKLLNPDPFSPGTSWNRNPDYPTTTAPGVCAFSLSLSLSPGTASSTRGSIACCSPTRWARAATLTRASPSASPSPRAPDSSPSLLPPVTRGNRERGRGERSCLAQLLVFPGTKQIARAFARAGLASSSLSHPSHHQNRLHITTIVLPLRHLTLACVLRACLVPYSCVAARARLRHAPRQHAA